MILAFIALIAVTPAAAVQGDVRAASTREPVPYAEVQVPALKRSTRADERGFFALVGIPAGEYVFRASAPGFRPQERTVRVPTDGVVRVSFALDTLALRLAPVVARGGGARNAATAGPAPVRLDAAAVDLRPALAEPDVLRTLQALPSVQASSDFSSALYVRGGSPDQNLILLDGAPLFNPFHLGGVFSALDPDAVASMDVFPGAFPARVGGRLSSVVELWTRDGGRDQVRTRGGVGLISARGSVDGPLPGRHGSFLLSARRTYLDAFSNAAAAAGLVDKGVPYGFTDAHFKLTHDVGALGRLSGSFYVDNEAFRHAGDLPGERDDMFGWRSRLAALNFRRPLGGGVLLEARGAVSTFGTDVDFFEGTGEAERRQVDAAAQMRDARASVDVTGYARGHELRAGISIDAYRFHYDVAREPVGFFADLVPEFRRADGVTTVEPYVEDSWRVGDALSIRAGVRGMVAPGVGSAVMPRFGLRYALSPGVAVTLGGGRYAQALHSLRNEESLAASILAYDILVAATDSQGLSTSDDVVAGAEYGTERTHLRVDAYARRLNNLALPQFPANPFEAPVLAVSGSGTGHGSAAGVELSLDHEGSTGGVTASYALSRARREVAGERFTPRFHRTHLLDVTAFRRMGEEGRLTIRLGAGTGQPFTPVAGLAALLPFDPISGRFGAGTDNSLLLGEQNSQRLPGYWRVDVGARRTLHRRVFGREGTVSPYFQILNVFNTRNVLIAEPRLVGEKTGGPELSYTPQLPFLPTLGVEWRF